MANGTKIRKGQHDAVNPYVLLLRDVAQNKKLSYEAVGLLTYLLSKPGDWEVRIPDLVRQKCKRGRVYSLLSELATAGHCKPAKKYQDAHGRWQWTAYEIYENPQPCIELPDTDEPYTENRDTLQSTESQNKEKDIAGKPAKSRKPKEPKPRERNLYFDAIVDAFGYDEKAVTANAGVIRSTAKQLKEAGYAPEQVAIIYAYCKSQTHWTGFSPKALPTHAGNAIRANGSNGNGATSATHGLRIVGGKPT